MNENWLQESVVKIKLRESRVVGMVLIFYINPHLYFNMNSYHKYIKQE